MKTLYKMNNVCKHVGAMGKALALAVVMLAFGNSAYAWQIEQGDVYFDNTVTKWSQVFIRFGTTSWCTVYKMSKMAENDNIYTFNFGGTVPDIEAIQFASVDGYNVTDPTQCYDNCGIYNGNAITDGQKTAFIKADLSGSNRCIVATGNTGYCAVSGPQPMPNSVGYNTTQLGGKSVTKDGIVGYFTPSQKVSFTGGTTLGYAWFPTGAGDYVHATFRYYLSGSTYSNISCSGNDHTKSFSTNVTLPSTPGKYTMGTYYRCGDRDSEKRTSYYHIVGLTGNDLNFGALKAGAKKSLTESLSNVWAGDDATSVSAVISDDDASNFSFSDSEPSHSTSIAITNKAGSADIYFTAPSDKGTYTATLTLTLTYDTDKTIVKTYTLTGSVVPDEPTVMLGAAPVCLDGPKATLSGYLKLAACNNDLKEAGIVWGSGSNPEVGKSGCTTIQCITGDTPIEVGTAWSGNTATNFTAGSTYHYRAYVIDKETDDPYYSADGTFTCNSACVYPIVGDTVYVTVDASSASVPCELKFQSIGAAVSAVTSNTTFCNATNKKLLKHIVISVVPNGKEGYTSGNEISGINDYTLDGNSKVMIIRSANPASQSTLNKVVLEKSKNIILDNLRILATNSSETALKLRETSTSDFQNIEVGAVKSSKVVIKNCKIQSSGFTGMEMWGYDDITFENNEIICNAPETSSEDDLINLVCWGSSMKVGQCSNIKFLRNNFRGSHTTSLWLQGLRGGLFMNNVFWNDNKSYYQNFANNTCFIRLVTQFPDNGGAETSTSNVNEKLGFYYNTFYLADNSEVTTDRYVDFFRLASGYILKNKASDQGTDINKNLGQNHAGTIRFQYNNCYSYDRSSVKGSNNQGGSYAWNLGNNQDWCTSINHNNFWSWIDNIGTATESVFNIPTNCTAPSKNYFVNVYEQVCTTTTEPSDLVVKGGDMNFGKHIDDDISDLGAEEIYNDRLYASNGADAIRKVNGKWTLGAYQQTDGNVFPPVKVLIWTGAADSDWDNRGNWITPKADGTGYKKLTCVENIDMDVQVIIPAPDNTEYADFIPEGGVPRYPAFPDKFSGTRTDKTNETVNAGHGIGKPTKFASTIELEYGGAIKNVEALKDDEARRYAEANTSFTAGRKEWILVGTVVRPFADGSKQSVRLVQSGDYFIAGHMPHVYMHEAEFHNEDPDNPFATWQTPFTQLDEQVPYDRVFAIKVPDQYGNGKLTASRYFRYIEPNEAMLGDGDVPKTFNFNGWFLNDEVIPEYKISGNKILSNTYPATLSVEAAQGVNHGSFKVYDYDEQNFENGVEYIKPQNGFIFIPTTDQNDGWFRITSEMLTSESTKYKSATASNPTLKLRASNPNGTEGSSSVMIVYDELKSNEYVQGSDLINTTIAGMPTKPEVYAMMYGKELDKLTVPSLEQAIPLGLKLERAMTVDFTIPTMEGIETAILEDREAGKSYDLLKGDKGSISLAAGTYAGRFYLNLGVEEKEDIPTEGDDVTSSTATIDLYGDGSEIIISSSESVILKSAEITDMSGNTTVVTLKNAHYNRVKVNGAQGVYVVKAIGDTKTETAKIIVK